MKAIREGVMCRLALLLCLVACLLFAVPAQAQQSSDSTTPQTPTSPAQTSSYSSQLPQGVSPALMKAPQPGHPLDPKDVEVLTGKDKPQPTSYYADGSPYYMYGSGYGTGFGYGRGSQTPWYAGDIFPQSGRDLSVPTLPIFLPRGFIRHRTRFAPPFIPLTGALFRAPLFGVHRPGFGFRF